MNDTWIQENKDRKDCLMSIGLLWMLDYVMDVAEKKSR